MADLRYHDLGDGYAVRLTALGLCPRLTDDEEVERAIQVPPERSPARQRGRLVRQLAQEGLEARVHWDSVRVGPSLGGQVIRLDEHRKGRGRGRPS